MSIFGSLIVLGIRQWIGSIIGGIRPCLAPVACHFCAHMDQKLMAVVKQAIAICPVDKALTEPEPPPGRQRGGGRRQPRSAVPPLAT